MSKTLGTAALIADVSQINAAIAKRQVECLDRQQQFASTQVATMASWLMASNLAINGAGTLAVINAAKGTHHVLAPGALFAIGILFALMNGVKLQDSYIAQAVASASASAYWAGVAIYGVRDPEFEQAGSKLAKAADRWNFLPPLFGWVSAILFLAGAITLTVSFQKDTAANEAQCKAIKREMLIDVSKREPDVQLFTALECSPN